jgi:hypothetical protein
VVIFEQALCPTAACDPVLSSITVARCQKNLATAELPKGGDAVGFAQGSDERLITPNLRRYARTA